MPVETQDNPQNAWVVFTGKTDIKWLRILKKNYRHCFVMINDGQRWVSVDPLSPYTDIQIHHHIEAAFDLPSWLRGQGYDVVKARMNKKWRRPAPWMMCSCVEIIKRIIGVHHIFIITPWQLCCYLKKQNKEI